MRLITAILGFCLLLAACNDDKKVVEKSDDGTTETTVDMNDAASSASEMEKKMEELKKLPPLTIDELKAMLPEQLAGMPRSDYNAFSNMGVSMATAKYVSDDQDIELVIYDGAGEAGAGIYSLHYWTKMNMQSEGSHGYTKTIDFKGGKAVETYDKNNNQYTLTTTPNDRLLVILTGHNTDANTLQQAAAGLNLK